MKVEKLLHNCITGKVGSHNLYLDKSQSKDKLQESLVHIKKRFEIGINRKYMMALYGDRNDFAGR